ncbi:hypothetical protein [Erwinia psidii]|uniref:Uncharacterized protein n=1 Tax=Erwinia psidii TaxID=69224 RepID=A0A3N6UW97_9GAMM|nr:hypothetical protein [Erwinia psidii]MCX8958133.1 hypothetical protein [Erwinia psidii]MCX8967358.1 hypothetical protein [Erwinia psidii]RQM37115.1 hypothetical protein EB241_17095 [Erwinia psidii]
MKNIEMEKKLADGGFTSKEIALLKNRIEKDNTTWHELLVDLRKRFLGGMVFLLVAFFLMGSDFFMRKDSDLLSMLLTLIFTSVVFWFVIPLKLGGKAFLFIRRNSHF